MHQIALWPLAWLKNDAKNGQFSRFSQILQLFLIFITLTIAI